MKGWGWCQLRALDPGYSKSVLLTRRAGYLLTLAVWDRVKLRGY